jgi:hypothetical protein
MQTTGLGDNQHIFVGISIQLDLKKIPLLLVFVRPKLVVASLKFLEHSEFGVVSVRIQGHGI